MSLPSPAPSGEPLDPAAALRQARARFIAGFGSRCDSIRVLAETTAPGAGPSSVLRQVVHRLAGLAGMVGFPNVSARARELEERVLAGDGATVVQTGVQRLVAAFSTDRERDAGQWAPVATADPLQVMVAAVAGEPGRRLDQALGVIGAAVSRVAADEIVATAGMDLPDLIVLPADAPGPDGNAGGAWLRLKSDPVTAMLPVIVVAPSGAVATLAPAGVLGPDDVIAPAASIDEMAARLRRQQARRAVASATPRPRVLAYDIFVLTAREVLAQSDAALALVHGAPASLSRVAALLDAEFRRRDLTATIGASHLVLLVPGGRAADVAGRLAAVAARAAGDGAGRVSSGVAPAARGERALPRLVEAANAALASDAAAAAAGPPRVGVVRSGAQADPTAALLRSAGIDVQVIDPDAAPRRDPGIGAVLVDLSGPAGAALGLLERLARADARLSVLALVPDAGLMSEAFRVGVTDCIALPGDAAEIIGRVRRAMC